MVKKKLNILLLLLLVVLSLSLLGTTSYAREITTEEIQNFTINYLKHYNLLDTTKENNILQTNFDSTWVETINNRYQGKWAIWGTGQRYIYLLLISSGTPYQTTRNGANAIQTTATGGMWVSVWDTSSTFTSNWNNANTIVNFWNYNTYYYFDLNIYKTSAAQQIYISAGTYAPNEYIFNENESPIDYFDFVPNIGLSSIIVDDVSMPYYNFNNNSADSFDLGILGLSSNYDYSEIFEYRYSNGWQLQNIYKLTSLGPVNNDLITVRFFGSALKNDTLYNITFYSNPDSDFDNISQPFYIGSRYTKIVDGVLDVDNTFSGDYFNNYNNNTNTDKIIDNINEFNPNELDNLVDFGEMPELDDPTSNLLSYLLNRISNVFLSDYSASYIDIPFYGDVGYRVYASWFDFFPEQLKTIVAIFSSIMIIKRFFPKIHDFVSAVQTAKVGHLAEKIQGGLSVVDIL